MRVKQEKDEKSFAEMKKVCENKGVLIVLSELALRGVG